MAEHPEYQTPSILPDNPLRHDDEAKFHFDDFAATLARLVANPKTRTPLTIGISGQWGSGKTTLLKRVKKLLDAHDKKKLPPYANPDEQPVQFRPCKTVWFDAWKYDDEAEILVALVRVLLAEMKKGGLIKRIQATNEDPQQPKYDLLNMFINAFQFKFGGLGAEVQVNLDPSKFEKESPYASHTAFFDYFEQDFARLLALWVHGTVDVDKINEEEGALVVFIDDLDRCLPKNTIQVLEAIKLFFDHEGCIFLLGADIELIQDAVASHYKEISGQKADDYLEKVIQLRFRLPQIGKEDMQAYLAAQAVHTSMQSRWQALVAAAEANPRRVKAVVNDLELQWTMLVNSEQAAGVNRDDFICWQALMRAAPASFRKEFFGIPEDPLGLKMRYDFITEALAWMCGSEAEKNTARGKYTAFESPDAKRLRDVLREIKSFSAEFSPETLNSLVYLVAPPQKSSPSQPPAEAVSGVPGGDEMPQKSGRALPTSRGEGAEGGRKEVAGIQFCPIQAGDFVMGSTDDNSMADSDEKPRHTVSIPYQYWLGRYPVTNAQFRLFIQANPDYRTTAEKEGSAYIWIGKEWKETKGADWQHPNGPKSSLKGKDDHPAVCISWLDARAYCLWFNTAFGKDLPKGWQFRLPTEAEWEKASRDPRGSREWPWGSEEPDVQHCNFNMNVGDTTPVGKYSPQGDSPYGCADMAGNVWEWTHTAWNSYPYQAGDGREKEDEASMRVLRGGSFVNYSWYVRCASRVRNNPHHRVGSYGFRLVASPISAL